VAQLHIRVVLGHADDHLLPQLAHLQQQQQFNFMTRTLETY
jgi:hypothetical protein